MKIAVIGAGAGGLPAVKYAIQYGFSCDVFEQTDNVGGTWNYTDKTGVDEYGLRIHSSMYKGLRTNIPKEVMEYCDFAYPRKQKISYITQQEVLDYINSYCDYYGLRKYIKFRKQVIKVEPMINSKWQLTVMDVISKNTENHIYDAVMVCNGHYTIPDIPKIQGNEKFRGHQSHSHNYRTPEIYTGKRVLVVGAGPSGIDITKQIATVAKKVYLSHTNKTKMEFPKNVVHKPLARKIEESSVTFEDISVEEIDEILYCTGYKYSFPFFTGSCGIEVDGNWVRPLYKQCININHPTMCLVGIPYRICPFPLFDLLARFFLSTLNGHFNLPSKKKMLEELGDYMAERDAKGISRKHAHFVGQEQRAYYNDIADTANIKRIPDAVHKIYAYISTNKCNTDCFEIINDNEYVKIS